MGNSRLNFLAKKWHSDQMISIQNMSIHSGEFRLTNVELTIPTGEYGVLMGETGCGKTTILEVVLGLRKTTAGKIILGDQDVTRLDPAVRGIGYVPQDGALFAGMTVREHLAFAMLIRRSSKKAIGERVDELAALLGLEHLLHRTPHGLSGGEAQRVALGRALSCRPQFLCLDEPLSALDSKTRLQMCDLLEDIRRTESVTTLHVTHNVDEAQRLADCLFCIQDGKIETLTSPAV